jgi:hypothetical protein
MVRRTLAIGAGVLVLILLVIAFRGCLSARQENAIKDYTASSNELIQESNREGNQLFDLLGSEGGQDQTVDSTNTVNALRSESATLVDRAEDLDAPDDVASAQDYLTESLELRRDALDVISRELPGALADQERRESSGRIADVMQVFLASDVLMVARFRPSLESALQDEGLEGEVSVADGDQLRFMPDVQWVEPAFVADQIAALRSGEGASGDEAAAPGLHGNGLGTVSLGGVALTPGGSATVPLASDLSFDVQVVNQGENNETDVNVRVTVGEGGDAIEVTEAIPEIAIGEAQNVTIPVGAEPPTGQQVPVTVEVEPVAGEEVTDNNEAEFSVIFTS